MTWTTTILRSGTLSRDRLINTVSDFCNDGSTSDQEIINKAAEIVDKVNDMMPGSLYWSESTSEIWADNEDDTRINEEEFEAMFDKAFEEVMYEKKDDHTEERTQLLEAMHTVMMHMNNENAYMHWVTMGVPDEPSDDDFTDIAADDDSYGDCIRTFEECMKEWIKDGICK